MIRFNYLADNARIVPSLLGRTIAIDDRIRGPLVALVAIVFLTGALALVQLSRLHAAQRAYAVTSIKLETDLMSAAQIAPLRTRVEAKLRLSERVANIRQTSLVHAAELAWIGNHLPQDTWLHTLRYENGVYSLDGTSSRVAAVGGAMMALYDRTRTIAPRLISLRNDATSSDTRVHFTLRLEPRP